MLDAAGGLWSRLIGVLGCYGSLPEILARSGMAGLTEGRGAEVLLLRRLRLLPATHPSI